MIIELSDVGVTGKSEEKFQQRERDKHLTGAGSVEKRTGVNFGKK